jgi:plastocyanin
MPSPKSAPLATSPARPAPERGSGRPRGRPGLWLAGLFLALLILAPGAARAAEIEGRVTLPPAQPERVVQQRYELLPPADPAAANRRYDIVTRGGVAAPNPPVAVVYLEGNFPAPAQPPLARMEQRGQVFLPALLPIQAGTSVEFPNFDNIFHNIFSFSPAKRFDLGRYRPNETPPPVLFDTPGLVTLRCDIHEHMRALILVLPTPHFVVTDREGRYRLPNLPPGNYTLKVWMDSKTTLSRPVVIPAEGSLRVDFP